MHSSSFAHPNEDGSDLPLVSLKTMKVLPYYQVLDWKNNPIKFDNDLQRVISLEIITNEYYRNQLEPKGLVGLRTCTREDFAGIEDVFDAKNEGVGQDTLICPDNMDSLQLQGSIANMKDRIHFSMAITECNPNTIKWFIKEGCETDKKKLRKKY